MNQEIQNPTEGTPHLPSQRHGRARRLPTMRYKKAATILSDDRDIPQIPTEPVIPEVRQKIGDLTTYKPLKSLEICLDDVADAPQKNPDASPASVEKIRTSTAYSSVHIVNAKKAPRRLWLWILLGAIALLFIGYLTFVFSPIPFVARWRAIYIQTAMSTADHQWLATSFMPKYVIDKNWTDPSVDPPDHSTEDIGTDLRPSTETPPVEDTEEPSGTDTARDSETDTVTTPPDDPSTEPPTVIEDILGLKKLTVGGKDLAGNTVKVVNREEGIYISEFSVKAGEGWSEAFPFKGYVMVIDDPSRVFVGTTPEKDTTGYRIGDMIDYYGDVIAGINASGFADPNNVGTGADIIGACMSEGEYWGKYSNNMESVLLTTENKLVVGWTGNWNQYDNIRDGMQFGPVLVKNGENVISEENGGGRGLHPRAAIGQREDGAIIMIVVDGRVHNGRPATLTHPGCTLWDMAELMVAYGAVTAGGCDGGSSVVMAYDGEIINENSSANPDYGRRLPNAFLVRSKKDSE